MKLLAEAYVEEALSWPDALVLAVLIAACAAIVISWIRS